MEDQDKIYFLRGMELMVGWTPGTEFEKATVKLEMTRGPGVADYFTIREILELCEYYSKLSSMISLGHTITPADRFTFHILKANKIFDAFNALHQEMKNGQI